MSFFSKITKELDDIFGDDKKKKEESHAKVPDGHAAPPADASRAFDQQPYGYGAPPQSQYPPPHQQYSGPAPAHGISGVPSHEQHQPYGVPPPSVPYGSHPSSQFSSPPPGQHYPVSSAPPAGGIPPIPHLPQGWQALWDPTGQRWAYLEVGTLKVSWSVPTGPSFAHGVDGSRGFGDRHGAYGAYGGGHDSHGYGGSHDAHGYGGFQHGDQHGGHGKDSGNKNVMLAAAGGLAVGAIGGAVIANALDDDDHHGGTASGYGDPYAQGPPPPGAPLPEVDADGDSVSSSDREEVEEARKEYEEAYEEAYGSD